MWSKHETVHTRVIVIFYLMRLVLLLSQSGSRGQQEIVGLPDERDQAEVDGLETPFRIVLLRRRLRIR